MLVLHSVACSPLEDTERKVSYQDIIHNQRFFAFQLQDICMFFPIFSFLEKVSLGLIFFKTTAVVIFSFPD